MRSFLVLILAAGLFAGFLVRNRLRASALLTNEGAVVQHLRTMARETARDPAVAKGYRFAWQTGAAVPELLVAGPLERGEDGVRWFATTDGVHIYEFDTALYLARGEPATGALRQFLALEPQEQTSKRLPRGWRLLE